MWYRDFYPRSRPRKAKGGIKAQSKRGKFGTSWWAKRWIAVLESFNIGGRLQRGRTYARGGQVLSIEVEKGKVTAKVQGSERQPYAVRIELNVLDADEWDAVLRTLTQQALFVARLLAGEMPQEIEEVFTKADVSLFPKKLKDLRTSCSCPDVSNPCKHIAAVYYLLGEEFDRDPFLLFRLRGLSREELMARLEASAPATPAETEAGANAPEAAEGAAEARQPLPANPASFWSAWEMPSDLLGEVQVPAQSAAWPKRLGSFPFWRGGERFLDALEPIYRQAARQGVATVLGERAEQSTKKR
jgi:uncharacterized Zn finger protein